MLLANVGPSALWYLTRATGTVSLVLLSVSVALGVANIGRLQRPGWPRFVVEGLHRNVSLLALALLIVHIVTSLLDPFAGIRLIDAIVPFTGSYRPIWLGLGAFASDLFIAVALTSVLRRRLGHRAWRATHWLAYLCWPVAIVHAVGTGSDVKQVWLLAVTAACIATVMVAVWARVGFGWPERRTLRGGALVASIALPALLVVWLPGGPLAHDWARRAGTPPRDLGAPATTVASSGRTSTVSPSTAVAAFSASVNGTVAQSQTQSGLVRVAIALTVANAVLPSIHLEIDGTPVAGGGVSMTASAVSIGTVASPSLFSGSVTSLEGTQIGARVRSTDGHSLDLIVALRLDPANGTAGGTVEVNPVA
jgi:DMSO/TMAO reductase YedYZ heme-binding membrane subunit